MRILMKISGQSAFLILISLGLFSCAASKFKVGDAKLTDHFADNPVFRESHSGLLVFDPASNKTVFSYNADKHFTPASNTKLLTYFAAVKELPDVVPGLEYCMVNDTLFFTGTGDPSLLYKPFPYSPTIDFLTTNGAVLAYCPRQIEDERLGPGWSWDDYPYYYSAEKSSFPIYGNVVHFSLDSSFKTLNITPDFFVAHTNTTKDPQLTRPDLTRDEFYNHFDVMLPTAMVEVDKVVPYRYSDELFTALLSDTLKRSVRLEYSMPVCGKKMLATVPTDSIAKYVLIDSDNFLAEQVLLMISGQLGDTLSSAKAINYIVENHLSSQEEALYWVDGSGLSRYNQVTPAAMVHVLRELWKEVDHDKLYTLLPESGVTGTLKNSFAEIQGSVHAKTGSMRHVYNLSGFLETNSGKTFVFSFMNNNFNASFSELKKEMERVLAVFVEKL